jgi:hypothetical protein
MDKRISLMAALVAGAVAAGPAFAADSGASSDPKSGSDQTKDSGPGMNGPALPPAATGSTPRAAAPSAAPAPTAQAPAARSNLDVAALHEISKDKDSTTYNGISAKNIEDMNVVNPAGKKIGEVDKVLATSDNKVVAVVVDAGGILGIGGDKVVVPLDQLTLDSQGKQFVASMDENQLKAMSKWQGDKGAAPKSAAPASAPPARSSTSPGPSTGSPAK